MIFMLFLLTWTKISGACQGYTVDNGSVYPTEVLEGSTVTVTCNQGFEIEGSKILDCKNGILQDSSGSELSTCVLINQGLSQICSEQQLGTIRIVEHTLHCRPSPSRDTQK